MIGGYILISKWNCLRFMSYLHVIVAENFDRFWSNLSKVPGKAIRIWILEKQLSRFLEKQNVTFLTVPTWNA